ncbi:hypothetical protein FRB96_000530 [Tulasnella sp. 330]|nr:hypothetical protein FRB96_000530 [Tulasnella sp. 330]
MATFSSPITSVDIQISSTFHPSAIFPSSQGEAANIIIMSSDGVFFYCCQTVLKRQSRNSFHELLPTNSDVASFVPPSDAAGIRAAPFPVIEVQEISQVLNIVLHIVYNLSSASYGPELDTLTQALASLPRYGLATPSPAEGSDFWTLVLRFAPMYPFRVYSIAAAHGEDSVCIVASEYTLQRRLIDMTEDEAFLMGGVRLWQLTQLHLGRTEALKQIIFDPPRTHFASASCSVDSQAALALSWGRMATRLIARSAPHSTSVEALMNGFGSALQEMCGSLQLLRRAGSLHYM